jgi:predicted TIM-barrel fold metal-dependent hydrolase
MRIDAHIHTFPEDIRADREKYFANEPAFKLLYESEKAKLVGTEDIIATLDEHEIDKAVIFGFPWENADYFKKHNDHVLDSVARYPDRLVGLCCLSPFHKEAAGEVERCLASGMSGVGELAFYGSGLEPICLTCLEPIMALCQDADVPIMIHTNEPVGHFYSGKTPNTLAQIYSLVKQYPNNRIILAHFGGGIFFYNLLKKEVRETLANVYFDTAASPFLYEPAVYRVAIDLVGRDKIMLGTDYPLLPAARYFKEITKAGLTQEEIDAICGGNAASVFNLG